MAHICHRHFNLQPIRSPSPMRRRMQRRPTSWRSTPGRRLTSPRARARDRPRAARGPLFAATTFLSAFLLFLVEPMIAKMVLPVLGGAPMVWNTCVVFFS